MDFVVAIRSFSWSDVSRDPSIARDSMLVVQESGIRGHVQRNLQLSELNPDYSAAGPKKRPPRPDVGQIISPGQQISDMVKCIIFPWIKCGCYECSMDTVSF